MPVLLSVLWTEIPFKPDGTQLPGTQTLQSLADGIGWWAVLACVVGIVIGAVMWAFGRRTTTMKSLVIGLDAPGGGVLAMAAPTGCSGGPIGPGRIGVLAATSRRAEVAAEPDRAGPPRQKKFSLWSGTVTREYSRVTTPNNALRVVPFSTLRATPTPGTAH